MAWFYIIFRLTPHEVITLWRKNVCVCVRMRMLGHFSCVWLFVTGSSVQEILQVRILEWVAMPSSRDSSQPRDQTCDSCIAGRFFTAEPPGKPREERTITSISEKRKWNLLPARPPTAWGMAHTRFLLQNQHRYLNRNPPWAEQQWKCKVEWASRALKTTLVS